ncbi:unnamed protein product [Bursaphelenchus okinawaensis]|uniref:Uncharacterized protein n=1 Tax=Bursaphelenchus okinawaensis TaxID=465554 RepID=A0A811JXV7_9BILA|nr:unnamed protein product [Bursaphelenchus okinawaensis]CAG9086715.1 unnamed protein product [Bursaphelenchus okinawaensis]
MRCMKYDSALQCTRCCTATVRRSVPLEEPMESEEAQLSNISTRTLERLLQTLGEERDRKYLKLRAQRKRLQRLQHETLTDIVENVLARRRV